MSSLSICYNVTDHHNLPEIPPLPEVYIVPIIKNTLGYVEKQATPEILQSLGIAYLETDHQQLLEICASLKPIVLENKFKPPKKRSNYKLRDILKDPKAKQVTLQYVYRKLGDFYSLVFKNQYLITYNAQRKDPFQDHRLTVSSHTLTPILEFTKTDEGIDYSFSLKDQETVIIPQQHTIQILLNQPSWITIGKDMYHIKNLNANKLKPFFDKEKITIAKKFIKTYLEKVIIPVIKNVDVVANGFDITTHQDITSYGIVVMKDFILENYVVKVVFDYNETIFDYNTTKRTSSNVIFGKNEDIKITQTKRNPAAEKEIIALLEAKGLIIAPSLLLEIPDADDPLAIFNWVQQNKQQLETEGFHITLPKIEDRTINVEKYEIEIENKKKMIGLISSEL